MHVNVAERWQNKRVTNFDNSILSTNINKAAISGIVLSAYLEVVFEMAVSVDASAFQNHFTVLRSNYMALSEGLSFNNLPFYFTISWMVIGV